MRRHSTFAGLIATFAALAAFFCVPAFARADGWRYWGHVPVAYPGSPRIATDGTNMFYSTVLDGVYRAALADGNFSLMPMTGFPLWDANSNTNGFGVWNLAVTPSGQLLISGSPVSVTFSNGNSSLNAFGGATSNTLPVFYWWDESHQLWHPATVTGKSYPYTAFAGNFAFAPDGAVWTCSGFASYAYRSTNDGKSFTAFDINASVPANYLPMPSGQTTFGKIFSILATPRNDLIIGTETGGFLRSTNKGLKWASLDPNFTNLNSTNPLGRVGNALVTGLDKYGNVLCKGIAFTPAYSSLSNWAGVTLIGWHPADGTIFSATRGIPTNYIPPRVVTMPSGDSFTYMNQNSQLDGGVYRSPDGKNWTQFNKNSPLEIPFAPWITNAQAQGNVITTLGQQVFIGAGNSDLYVFDDTSPPITNRPPVAIPQNVNLWRNSPTNFSLTGRDADGDALNFTITQSPTNGVLTGTPPNLSYLPNTNFLGTDWFAFAVDDGMATSAPVIVNFAVNAPTNPPPVVSLTTSASQGWALSPAAVTVTASIMVSNSFQFLIFYHGTNQVAFVGNPPLSFTFTNLLPGDYLLEVQAVNKFEGRAWAAPIPVTILPVAPRGSISSADSTNVAVSWPLELDGFYLETKANLTDPWTLLPIAPLYFTNAQTVTLPVNGQQFFRLMRP